MHLAIPANGAEVPWAHERHFLKALPGGRRSSSSVRKVALPMGHGLHFVAPVDSAKVPAAHGVQLAAPAVELKVPVAHGVQRTVDTLPSRTDSEYWPEEAAWQDATESAACTDRLTRRDAFLAVTWHPT